MTVSPPSFLPGSPEIAESDASHGGGTEVLHGPFFVDAHVHLHAGHDPGRLLDAAWANLRGLVRGSGGIGVLVLTEADGEDAFERLAGFRSEHWLVTRARDGAALFVSDHRGRIRFLVLAGAQTRTGEGLEVLTLGTRLRLPDGRPFEATVAQALALGIPVVLPWSPGKWWFGRGRLVRRVLDTTEPAELWLGDIRGRPGPDLGLLRRAKARGFRILAGSDPLPLPGEEALVGSFGSRLDGRIRLSDPSADFRALLRTASGSPPLFGGRQSLATSLRRQVRLRLSVAATLPHDTRTPDVHAGSAQYARRFSGPVGRLLLEGQRTALERLPLDLERRRVLELGGGHGQLLAWLLERGAQVVVQGSRLEESEVTRLRPARAGGPPWFVTSSLWKLPFADRSFDYVVAIRLLAHIERRELEQLVGEMARVARRGIVVDFTPRSSIQGMGTALFALKRRVEGDTRPYFTHGPTELRRLFARFGFEVSAVERQFWLPMALHRGLGRPGLSASLERIGERLGLVRLVGGPAVLLAEHPAGEG